VNDVPLKPLYSDRERKLGIPLVLAFAAIGAAILSWWLITGNRWGPPEETTTTYDDSSGVVEYYLPTVALTEAEESTPVVIIPEPDPLSEPVDEAQAATWRASDESSMVWTITDTPLYACPEASCDVVTRLPAGLYLLLPYTLASDGWVRTRYGQEDARGYLSAGDLSVVVPERCRHRMTYSLGHIGQRFLDAGFTRQELEVLLRDAEGEVEQAVGWDFLQLTDDAWSTLNFVISHYRDAEESHRGLHVPETVFPDEVVASFWIGIYAALLDDVESFVTNGYIAPSQRKDVISNVIYQTLIHELVHTTGFGHHDDPTGVMCGEPNCRPASVDFTKRQSLRPVDREAITEWCRA